MNKTRILTAIIFLFLSYSAYSQIADGRYVILHMGHLNDSQENATYDLSAPADSYVVFDNNNIGVFIGNYRVDVIKYEDKEPDNSNNSLAQPKAYSYSDNKEKSIFLRNLEEKGMHSLWIERGSGGFDIFIFLIP